MLTITIKQALNKCDSVLDTIRELRERDWEEAIREKMKEKTFRFFGRTLSREEAILKLHNDNYFASTHKMIFRWRYIELEEDAIMIRNQLLNAITEYGYKEENSITFIDSEHLNVLL
jgi:hypothetical protein